MRRGISPGNSINWRSGSSYRNCWPTAEWLLRTWQQETWLKQVNDGWAKDKEEREKRLERIRQLLTKDKEKASPQWYVNSQGQTIVVIPGPVEFLMGSPPTEEGRKPGGDAVPLGEGTHRHIDQRTTRVQKHTSGPAILAGPLACINLSARPEDSSQNWLVQIPRSI